MSASTLRVLDPATAELVRLAAVVAAGTEPEVRRALQSAQPVVPMAWVDELIVQSYLFSGFPRALNAAREWRRISPVPAPETVNDDLDETAMEARGERTCAAVYARMFEPLRANVSALHPALERAMLVEGYGRILGRPALDLQRRELCVMAACAVTGQDRQLHSHLHGSLNVGVSEGVVHEAIDLLASMLGASRTQSLHLLLRRVVGK